MNEPTHEIELILPGAPRTWKPPRQGKNGAYPDPGNTANVRAWRALWMAAGAQRLPPPIVLEVYIRVERPKSHLRANRTPNAEGLRRSWPGGFDCSNVIKLVEDALKNHAFGDDAEIVAVHSYKRWVSDPDAAGTFVTLRTAGHRESR